MNKPVTRKEMETFKAVAPNGAVVGGKEEVYRKPDGEPVYAPNRFERSHKKNRSNNRKTTNGRVKTILKNVDKETGISTIKSEFNKRIF